MKKAVISVLVIATALALLVWRTRPVEEPLREVRINITPDVASSALWVAQTGGFFKAENLAVDLRIFPSGKDALQDLLDDQRVDYSFNYMTPAVRQVIAGHELRALTAMHTSGRNTRLVMLGARPALKPQGLKGKRIGVQRGTSAEFALSAVLERNGLRLTDVVVVDTPTSELHTELMTGTVDGAMIWNPYLMDARTLLDGASRAYWMPDMDFYHEFSFLTTDAQRLDKNQDINTRVLRAIYAAYQLYQADPGRYAELASELPGLDRGAQRIQEELKDVDLTFGLSNQMVYMMGIELRFYCTSQTECNETTLERLARVPAPSSLKQVAPQLYQLQ